MAVVTPIDRPKSDCNRCVIEVFVVVFLCCHVAFWIYFSVGVGAFVIGMSQISSFLTSYTFVFFSSDLLYKSFTDFSK